jgi:hypothetical protein
MHSKGCADTPLRHAGVPRQASPWLSLVLGAAGGCCVAAAARLVKRTHLLRLTRTLPPRSPFRARRKGISKSALPYRRTPPSWLKTTTAEVADQVVKLAKKGLTPSQIGVILRDSHGIAQVRSVTGNKVLRILKGNGAPPDPAAVLPAPLCPSGRTSSPGQCASAAPGRRRRGQQRPATAASSRSRSRAADVVLSRFFGCSAGRTRP